MKEEGQNKSESTWCTHWFDSPFYRLLYKDRNQDEADLFVSNLFDYLKPVPSSQVLDLACGCGRHATTMNKKGMQVTGLDASKKAIEFCQSLANESLRFEEFEMRKVYKDKYFDYVFSFFTSFGYYEKDEINQEILQVISTSLKPGGYFLLDYFNPVVALNTLVDEEIKNLDGIEFRIRRKQKDNILHKSIQVKSPEGTEEFEERIKLYTQPVLHQMLQKTGLQPEVSWGDYLLNPYSERRSERMIILSRLK